MEGLTVVENYPLTDHKMNLKMEDVEDLEDLTPRHQNRSNNNAGIITVHHASEITKGGGCDHNTDIENNSGNKSGDNKQDGKDKIKVSDWNEFTQNTTFHGVKYIFEDTPIKMRR